MGRQARLNRQQRQAQKDAESARLAGLAEQKAADQARKDLARAEMSAYVNRITLAQVEWEHGSAALAWDHLQQCQWNLRGWEHRYLVTQFNKNATSRGTQAGSTAWRSAPMANASSAAARTTR